MKKVAAFCLMAMLMLSLFAGNALAFGDYTGEKTYTDNVDAYAVMLFDADSGTILYQKNIDEQIEPASTTKILTLLIALEQGNMDDMVTVSSKAGNTTGSTLDLFPNERLKFKDLITGMMLVSGNDAAVAVAEHMAGSVDAFVGMMNAKAQEIGMAHTNFTTPHGLHDENHYTTARDMATLTLYAMKNPNFAEIVKKATYDMPADNKHSSGWTVTNSNRLLLSDTPYFYQYATGIKTGSTPAAGDCLVSSASKDDMNLICLVYKTDEYESAIRWTLPKDLFEWGFNNFKTVDLATLLEKAEPLQAHVENAAASDSGLLEFNAPEVGSTYVTLDRDVVEGIMDGTDSLVPEAVYNSDPLQAPVAKDDVVGTVTYKSAGTGKAIYSGNLIASRDVPKLGSEPNASGATAVETQTPVPPVAVDPEGNGSVWWWLLIPAALIAFLVIRLLTVNQRKRKRFKHRQPHYSYRIKK